MKQKWISLLAALLLLCVCAALPLAAAETPDGMAVLVDECFDDYDGGVDGSTSTLSQYFIVEANSIGNGSVTIEENAATGNLHLKSRVFTQVYTTTPLTEGYVFSVDVLQTQGDKICCLFLRAPQVGTSAYYESDGHENSACQSGVVLYCRSGALEVNVKTYDSSASTPIVHNIFSFDLPEGVAFNDGVSYTNIRVEDNNTEMKIYVADTLLCRLVMSDPNSRGYRALDLNESCFQTVTIYDANGEALGTMDKTLVGAAGATLGWATRVAEMIVDNVKLMIPAAADTEPETTTSETTPIGGEVTTPDTGSTSDSDADTERESADGTVPPTDTAVSQESHPTHESESADTTVRIIDDSLAVYILIAVMLVAIGGTAAYVTVKTRK